VEFYLNDTKDRPDYLLGENLGGKILRDMENPSSDGNSIDNVCNFNNDMNVHYTSGVLNKAFVQSIRACEANGCSDERGCTLLMGPLFMYANIHKLTKLSGYLDSASQTCKMVEEFFNVRKPDTTCTASQTTKFVTDGWAKVGVTLGASCGASASNCALPDTPVGSALIFGCVSGVVNAYLNVRDFFGRFPWIGNGKGDTF
jgi:Zn-dependent metalloprotease